MKPKLTITVRRKLPDAVAVYPRNQRLLLVFQVENAS
jgi:hypothetical protein